MIIELPCGIIHDDKIYDRVRIKELTGRQQNYLVDMELVADSLGHVPKLLEDLTADYQTAEGLPLDMPVKEAIWRLSSEDVEFILLKIREATYGPVMALPVACPHCGLQQTNRIDLDKLEVVQLSDKTVRTKKVELPKSEQTAEVKLLYLRDLFSLYKVLRDGSKQLYTGTLTLSVAKLGEKDEITEDDLLDLPVSDLQKIEEAFTALRGSLDTTITHECSGCKQDFDTPLPVMDPSFFVQSQTPKT